MPSSLDVPLVISANSLRRADFVTRVQSASRAGFSGVGLRGTGLCDALPDVLVTLEHIPYSPIRTLDQAVALLRDAGRPNGRLVLDSWHFVRSGSSRSTLRDVRPDEVGSVQLSDVLPEPLGDLADEARHHRTVPGEGVVDIAAWYADVLALGVRRPTSIEVVNDTQDSSPPAQIALDLHAALTRTIAAAAAAAAGDRAHD